MDALRGCRAVSALRDCGVKISENCDSPKTSAGKFLHVHSPTIEDCTKKDTHFYTEFFVLKQPFIDAARIHIQVDSLSAFQWSVIQDCESRLHLFVFNDLHLVCCNSANICENCGTYNRETGFGFAADNRCSFFLIEIADEVSYPGL